MMAYCKIKKYINLKGDRVQVHVEKAVYLVKWKTRKMVSNICKEPLELSKIHGKILSDYETNKVLAEAVQAGVPFMAGRYGASELNLLWRVKDNNNGFDFEHEKALAQLHQFSGFFPCEDKMCYEFAKIMKDSSSEMDLCAVWGITMEDYVLKKWGKSPQLCNLSGLEPFFVNNPWTKSLRGKKVLIIHPFKDTILRQYEKRENLFGEKEILPEFDLKVLRAVQTIAGNRDSRFNNWFEALEYMYKEAMKIDFDVAIIGCGSYGFPLAAMLRKSGKIAVHMGGATQLLFGIKGRRWEEREQFKAIMNDYWVRPDESEVPQNAVTVENGCYW